MGCVQHFSIIKMRNCVICLAVVSIFSLNLLRLFWRGEEVVLGTSVVYLPKNMNQRQWYAVEHVIHVEMSLNQLL